MSQEETMSIQEPIDQDDPRAGTVTYQEEVEDPAGTIGRRTLVAFGVGVAALSGLAAAAVIGGVDTSGYESFPISTCCINPS
nr:hypothetical protein [Micromonospora sp. DSM 115978]